MSDQTSTAIVENPADRRLNRIDELAEAIYEDDRWDFPLSWSDAWNAARIAIDAGWRRDSGRRDT